MSKATTTPTVTLYTDAPEVYDGFGTRTLEVVGTSRRHGNAVRLVEIQPQHRDWQVSRYMSGLYNATWGPDDTPEMFERLGVWEIGAKQSERSETP